MVRGGYAAGWWGTIPPSPRPPTGRRRLPRRALRGAAPLSPQCRRSTSQNSPRADRAADNRVTGRARAAALASISTAAARPRSDSDKAVNAGLAMHCMRRAGSSQREGRGAQCSDRPRAPASRRQPAGRPSPQQPCAPSPSSADARVPRPRCRVRCCWCSARGPAASWPARDAAIASRCSC